MTDNEIIKALECCKTWNCEQCINRNRAKTATNCRNELVSEIFDLINRQTAEIEELEECYTNLVHADIAKAVDTEKDRQLLCAYQNIFLDLGYDLEVVSDPELKEVKAWKERMIWHCRRSNEQIELYDRTMARLKRAGVKDPTAQVIALAEEIERYRGKINALEELLQKVPETEEAKE